MLHRIFKSGMWKFACYYSYSCVIYFSGKTELELPETRKRMGDKASFVNVYPFVWKEFQENGYVTGDSPLGLSVSLFLHLSLSLPPPPTHTHTLPLAPSEFCATQYNI
jgi:hypothetical protein